MLGYKAFNKDWTCKEFQYKIGETYELPEGQELEICKCGFHFCLNPIDVFGYYPLSENTVIAKVDALGKIQSEGTKYCTDKIKILCEFTRKELQELIRSGNYNSGLNNTGNYNSGNRNSGNYNSGDNNSGNRNTGWGNSGNFNTGHHNTGNYNTGRGNTGSCNTGDRNTGSNNTGHCNTGTFNTGDRNTGEWNTGNFNTGNCNVGNFNTGSYNTGDYNAGRVNTGDWNTGNYNCGIFNTNEPFMRAFNKPTNIKYSEFLATVDSNIFERIYFRKLNKEDIEVIKSFPNFDSKIFKEITGLEL